MIYMQRENTKYSNNEFENMPSIDFFPLHAPHITARNESSLNLELIREICDKHGFKYTFIHSTFCGDDADFVLYLKTPIDVTEYESYIKNWNNLTQEDKNKYWEIEHHYDNTFKELHECMHELDERTELYFECGWVGNCGIFGNSDVKRKTYCGGRSLSTWRFITDHWSPSIHDTFNKLLKGIYVMAQTSYMKPKPQDSPLLEDYEPILLDKVITIIGEKYTASFEVGKRNCDTNEYKALVVRDRKYNDYLGMLKFKRDIVGRYFITTAAPLCGESSWVMNWEDPYEDLKVALNHIL